MKINKKVKTIQISEQTHSEIVKYCNENSLKINLFVDKILSNTIRSLTIELPKNL
jgi:hypothetical protein